MIITIVADVLGEENNGTTITIKRLINGLIERGHTVKVVSPYKDEKSKKKISVKAYTFFTTRITINPLCLFVFAANIHIN